MTSRLRTYFLLSVILFPTHGVSAMDSLAKKVAETFLDSKKTILALGETAQQESVERFVREIVGLLGFHISYVAVQSPDSSFQDEIDAYLDGKSIIVQSPALLPLLKSVRQINNYRQLANYPKIKVIALDLPTDGYSNESTWFETRDLHMLEILREKSHDFKDSGILYLGAAHISASAVHLPKVSRRLLKNNRTYMKGLGSLLEMNLGRQFVMRVLVHMRMPIAQRFSTLPTDYYHSYSLFDSFEESTLMRSNSEKIVQAEKGFEGGRSGMVYPISNNFDYFVRLPSSSSRFVECVDLLVSPVAIVKGVALKILSR